MAVFIRKRPICNQDPVVNAADKDPVAAEIKKPANRRAFSGATGLEPAISGLTGRRDNQLRYAPFTFANISVYQISVNICITLTEKTPHDILIFTM